MEKARTNFLVAMLCVCSSAAFAQNYSELNGPFGGQVYDILSTGTTLIASVPGQGIVRSTDGGSVWEESNTGINDFYIRDLEWDEVSGKIYALADQRLYSSSDDGLAWITEASSGFEGASFLKRASSYFFIISQYSKTVYRSTNGTNWSVINTIAQSGSITDVEVDASGDLFVATNGAGVFRSTDNGLTFEQLDAAEGLTNSNLSSLSFVGSAIYALAEDGPYKSVDGGDTWLSVRNASLPDEYYGGAICSVAGSVFIFTYSKAWISTDGGSSWSAISFPLSIYGGDYAASVHSIFAKSATELYVSFVDLGIFKTTDGGTTWSEKNNGITGLVTDRPNSLMFVPANNRLLNASGYPFGFSLSIDDGSTWDFVKSAPNDIHINGFKMIGSTIYAYGAGINKSTDNGQTWTEVYKGPITSCSPLQALINTDNTTFYSYSTYDCSTGAGYYLLKSVDAGVTWTSHAISNLPDPTTSLVDSYNLHADGEGNLYLLIYNYSGELNTTQLYRVDPVSFAATYISNIGTTSSFADMDSYNGTLYLLANEKKLYISTDGADTWTSKATPYGYHILRVINENTLYILSPGGAFLSTDGGNDWTNTGSFGHDRNANEVILSPSNYSYIQVEFGAPLKSLDPVIPPVAPTDLTVNGVSEDDVALTWTDNSTNEDYFIVERSANDNLSYDSVGTAERGDGYPQNFVYAESSYLDAETVYYFRVRAKGPGGKSSYSNEVSVTTLKDCKPTSDIPLNRSWTATTLNESGVGIKTDPGIVITQWSGNDGFYIISNLNIGSASTGSIHGDVPAYLVENCGNVFMYEGDDIQRNNGTWDASSKTLTIQWQTQNFHPAFQETTVFQLNAVDPAPAAPANVSAYIKSANEVVVTWTVPSFAQQCQVQRSTTSGTGFVNVGSPVAADAQQLVIDNDAFVLGTTYYYRVIATGSGGDSPPSAEAAVSFQTPLFDAISIEGFDKSSQGVAWIDLDNDNDEDLLIAPFSDDPGLPIVVYENTGNSALQRLDVPGVSDMEPGIYRWISVGDINNDDQLDFMTNGIDLPASIFINKGNKEFKKVALVPGGTTDSDWYGQLADFNNDGRLDATISHDENGPFVFLTQTSAGDFAPYELGEIAADRSPSRGASWADYDNDGDQDFLRSRLSSAATDFDQLYRNSGDGTFAPVSGTAFEEDFALSPRTISWADFDNDLDLDVFIGHNFPNLNNMLYANNGDGTFTRMPDSAPAQPKTLTTYGSAWGDIDNDGDLDLVVANSSQSELFLNDGSGGFTKYSGTEYLVAPDATRTNIAFAMADFDNNGTLDIATGRGVPEDSPFPSVLLKNNLVPGADSHWLKVRLRGTTSNHAGVGARIIVATPDGKRQMRVISSISGYASCNSLIAHFGLKNNATVTAIQIHWPSGIVQNIGPQNADQLLTITEDGAGPANTSLAPSDNAVDVLPNTELAITFDEAPIPQAGKKLSVYATSNLSTPVFQENASAATVSGNTVTFKLPADLEQLTSYTAVLDAGAFADQFGNPTDEISWTFTTIDNTEPDIQFDAPATQAKGVATTFSPLVTDNNNVKDVILHYRQISKKEFLTLTGTLNATNASQYDFPIPSSFFDETGLEYYFTATDPASNEARHPDTGTHKTYVLYSEENTNITTLGFGGDKEDWKIFAIPFELEDNSIASIFDEVVGNTALKVKIDYAFLAYKDQTSWSEYPSFTTIQRGKGYFSNIVNPSVVRIGDNLVAPQNDRNNLFSMDLAQGWNMIGNPYLSAISWTDVAAYNGLEGTAAELKKYVSGAYSVDDQNLQPFQGGFVFAPSAIPDVKIPFSGQASPTGGRKGFHNLGSDIDAESWALKFNLTQGESSYQLGAIGMVPDASLSFDNYDDITPPRLFDYLEINFMHPEFHAKHFTRDIVPTQEKFSWDFEVDSNVDGIAELSWDQTAIASSTHDILLLDKSRYKVINMKNTGIYSFDPAGSQEFAIYFGTDLQLSAPAVSLGSAFPNPTNGVTVFGFSLPEEGGLQQHAAIRIIDAMGREVATAVDGTFNPGYHEVSWDAKDMISGFYTYRLIVNGHKATEMQVGKLVIK